MVWSVILPLWYFELYFTQNNMYWISINTEGPVWGPRKNLWRVLGSGKVPELKHARLGHDSPNPWEVKVDSGVHLGPKHIELVCDNPSPWKVKMCSNALPGPKHATLERDSPSLGGVKVGPVALSKLQHAGLRHDSSSLLWKWFRVQCLDPNTLGSSMTARVHEGWKWEQLLID
jgi:hypothetical protein